MSKMGRKSITTGYSIRQNNLFPLLFLAIFCIIQSSHLAQSQAIMNQLAALFRSRPAWPTNFPSGTTTTNSNGNENAEENDAASLSFADALNSQISKGLGLEDFSHFNDLLTGQSINQLHSENNNGDAEPNSQQLYPAGAPILATSHPLPQLEIQDPSGNGKSIPLIAHPVLGPNPVQPPESPPEHKFNGMMVNPMNLLNDNAGLYSQTQRPPQPPPSKPSAVRFPKNINNHHHNNQQPNDRLKNSFQNFAHKLFFPNSNKMQQQNNNNNHKNNNFQKMIQMSGKPPPGGKIIAIPVPVPSSSSLWKNQHFGGRRHHQPQIIAVRQPFPPITSVPISQSQGEQQHVTSFLAKFSPSPMDLSSYAPVMSTTADLTTTPPFTTMLVTNETSTTNVVTHAATHPTSFPTMVTFSSTTSPPIQNHHVAYNDQISMSSNERFSTANTPSSTFSTSTTTTTTIRPHNNIQDVIHNAAPSQIVHAFRYPDPPTPPRMQNMNTRYELESNNSTKSSHWVPKPFTSFSTTTTTQSPYYSDGGGTPSKNGNNNGNGFFSSISSIPLISSLTRGSRSKSKWKHEDSSNSASETSTLTFKRPKENADSQIRSESHKSDPSFKPSLQLHSFEDTTSGLREFITINPHISSFSNKKKNSRDGKSLFSQTTAASSIASTDSPSPVMEMMESGFRPFNHFAFVNGISSASISSTTESSMMNRLRDEWTKDIVTANVWNNMEPTKVAQTMRQNRQYFSAAPVNGYLNTKPFFAPAPGSGSVTVGASYANGLAGLGYNYNAQNLPPTLKSMPTTRSSGDWVGKYSQQQQQYQFPFVPSNKKKIDPNGKPYVTSTASSSSSELYEDWLLPTTKRKKENTKDSHKDAKSSAGSSFSISTTSSSSTRRFKSPSQCDKFHRFGFCPVSPQYPLEKVESIGVRCTTLLSHLIAPLPKTDVRYDVIVPKNGSHSSNNKGKGSSGWSWKTFAGKPVCDTKEAKILPGWAKNELGEWLVVLQTEEWKQEAQISLCTQNSQHSGGGKESDGMKCVQRFTAQRLVVLDPADEDRCPVVRSVFLPSACVCLNDGDDKHHGGNGGKKEKKSSKHRNHHHKHHSKSNSTKSSGGSDDDKKPASPASKTISGRSLFTTLFGLDLEPAATTNHETVPNGGDTSSSSQQDSKSEESKPPVNPNSPFMIIEETTGEQTSTESGESNHRHTSKRSISSTLGSSFLRSARDTKNNDKNDSIGDHSLLQSRNANG